MGNRRDNEQGQWDEPDQEQYEYTPGRRTAAAPAPRRSSRSRPYRVRPRRRRRVWSVLMTGCGLGVLALVAGAAVVVFLTIRASQGSGIGIGPIGSRTFTKEDHVQVPLTTITQMQICDKIGNVSLRVDPTAKTTTVATKKMVSATGTSEAAQEFARIAVEVQPPGNVLNALTCTRLQPPSASNTNATPATQTASSNSTGNTSTALVVNVTIPDSDGLWHKTNDSVDVAVTLPPSVLPTNQTPLWLDVEAPVGDISVDGLSGVLNLNGSTGDVDVEHGVLADGSHIETGQGNVTFNGMIQVSTDANKPSRSVIQSEQGGITVILPGTTNITIDANTNVGAIKSEFPINVNNTGGPVSYHGPLNPDAGNPAAAELILDVSTGNVNIVKAA